MASLTTTQTVALLTNQVAAWTTDQVAALKTGQTAALTTQQIRAGLTTDQIVALTTASASRVRRLIASRSFCATSAKIGWDTASSNDVLLVLLGTGRFDARG